MAFTKKPRVFILGISSLLGNALAWHLRKKFDVTGAYFHNPVYIPDVQSYPISSLAQAGNILETLVQVLNPNFCIMAAGINDRKLCTENTKGTELLNIHLPLSLAIVTNRIKAKNIHLSCADIFDGHQGSYKEKDVTSYSLEEYSKQKISAESFIKIQTMENTTLRLGRVVGLGSPFRYNYFDHIRSKLAAGKSLITSPNKIHSFLSLRSFCSAIETILENPIPTQQRLFHVGGPSLSEKDLVEKLCTIWGYNKNLLSIPNQDEDYKSNLSIDSSLFSSTYSSWKEETKEELINSIVQDLKPAQNTKKQPTI